MNSKPIRDIFLHLALVLKDEETAARVVREISVAVGGQRITVPTVDSLNAVDRRIKIHYLYDVKNYSVTSLADLFGLSKSQIKHDLNNPALFGRNN